MKSLCVTLVLALACAGVAHADPRFHTEGAPRDAMAAMEAPEPRLDAEVLAKARSAAADISQRVPQWVNGSVAGQLTVLEAENFTVAAGSLWSAQEWARSPNYFASTVTNTFHSRRAYLHAPAVATPADVASAAFTVAATGSYSLLARYESLFRFETPFLVTVSQGTKTLLSRVYGYRESLKVWPFGISRNGRPYGNNVSTLCQPGLVAQCNFPWGSTEDMTWEGVGVKVALQAGVSYVLSIAAVNSTTAHVDPELLVFADRNVDVFALVPNDEDIEARLIYEYNVLALDGLLTQAGEVFFQVHNTGSKTLNLTIPRVYGHSPYYAIHLVRPVWTKQGYYVSSCDMRGGSGCTVISVPAGGTSAWVDVGDSMDTLNHGSWNFAAGEYSITVGVGSAAKPTPIGTFTSGNSSLQLLVDANTRATRRVRGRTSDFWEIKAQLDAQTPTLHGKLKTLTPVYATTFSAGAPSGGGSSSTTCPNCGSTYTTAQKEYAAMFNLQSRACSWPCDASELSGPMAYVDLRSHIGSPTKLATALQGIKNASVEDNILVVSLGDEITVSGGNTSDWSFQQWCTQQKLSPTDVGCSSWAACHVSTNISLATSLPASKLFYYSTRFVHETALGRFAGITKQISAALPKAKVGANFSPTSYFTDPRDGKQGAFAYTGEVYEWISTFRAGAMTLPWSEDWIWQSPVGSQQMMTLLVDVLRSGITKFAEFPAEAPYARPDLVGSAEYRALPLPILDGPNGSPLAAADPIMMYIMAHYPGNTMNSWRRQLYGDLAHGVKYLNTFMFEPSWSGYTCDYVDGDGGAYPAVRAALNELGLFEDIIQGGVAQAGGAKVALLYSDSADIWLSPVGTFGAAKRTLYIALRHAQLPIDIVTEQDAIAGALNHYSVLYVVDQQVSEAAVTAIAAWVNAGGSAVFTAGAGLRNEFNATNAAAAALLGVQESGLWTGTRFSRHNASIHYAKQDLAFAEELDVVTVLANLHHDAVTMPVLGHKSIFTVSGAPNVTSVFADGSPAVVETRRGKGTATYAGLAPGLAYFHQALPKWPACRGSTDDAYNHWVPYNFSAGTRAWLATFTAGVAGAVPVSASDPLVEVGIVTAPSIGSVLPIIDWTGDGGGGSGTNGTATFVNITLASPITFTSATMATGASVVVSSDKLSFAMNVTVADALILR